MNWNSTEIQIQIDVWSLDAYENLGRKKLIKLKSFKKYCKWKLDKNSAGRFKLCFRTFSGR